MSTYPSVEHVNVYAIPLTRYGYDGQTGVAAVLLKEGSSEDEFAKNIEQHCRDKGLPAYAIPRFLRFTKSDAYVNASFKTTKVSLRNEGVIEGMYILPREGQGFKLLDAAYTKEIVSGRAKI